MDVLICRNKVFIYCPVSGDPVFANRTVEEIKTWKWANGCRHAEGGVHLKYETAIQNKFWRDKARIAAGELIQILGGLAWDDRGTVHILCPAEQGKLVDEFMEATCRAAGGEILRGDRIQNVAACILAGWKLSGPPQYGEWKLYWGGISPDRETIMPWEPSVPSTWVLESPVAVSAPASAPEVTCPGCGQLQEEEAQS